MTIRVIIWMMVILAAGGMSLLADDQLPAMRSIGSAITLGPGNKMSLDINFSNAVSNSASEENRIVTGRLGFSSDLHFSTLSLITTQNTILTGFDPFTITDTRSVEMTLIPKMKLHFENETALELGQFLVTSINYLDAKKIDLASGTVVLNFAYPQTLGVEYQFPHAIPLLGDPTPGLNAAIGVSLIYPRLAVHERFTVTAVSPRIKIVGETEFNPQPMETLTISAFSAAITIDGKLALALAPYRIDAVILKITAARSVFSLYLKAGLAEDMTYVRVGAAYNF